jgi:hypothetical protein
VEAIERMKKWQQEREDKASNIALAEENLKEKGTSLDRREMDRARREKDLAFREEMLERRGMLLAEHELEAEEKERKLEEWIRRFKAAQAARGPQVTEATVGTMLRRRRSCRKKHLRQSLFIRDTKITTHEASVLWRIRR